ncbi:MAG: sigma-70 family RNA polymerase sigma factor [Sphingomonas sp.]|nr:MAG: sigma-70 family RNA polymerase sigma factor [Sphingomonas sp.]
MRVRTRGYVYGARIERGREPVRGNLALRRDERSAGVGSLPAPRNVGTSIAADLPFVTGTSLDALVIVHRDSLLRYLRAYVTDDAAQDVLQELWLKASKVSDPEATSRAYLMRMAHNLVIDQARSARQRRHRDDRWLSEGPVDFEVDGEPDAERTLIARERLTAVEEAVRGLGSRTERILRRHRIDGVTQREVAAEERISVSSVEKHLQRAYRRLAALRLVHLDTGDRV